MNYIFRNNQIRNQIFRKVNSRYISSFSRKETPEEIISNEKRRQLREKELVDIKHNLMQQDREITKLKKELRKYAKTQN